MAGEAFFFQAVVYLAAAVVSVPIAKRAGLGSVLGYLIAGVVIGPFALGLVGEAGSDVMHFAEFGVVMMLFLVGLELEPERLWRLRGALLGLGGLQVGGTALLALLVALLAGLTWQAGLAIGLTLAMSSTAIVLQTLDEKGLMRSPAGQSAFAVLLFQDLAVIPILAIFPLLAPHGPDAAVGHAASGHATTWIDGLPASLQTLAVLLAVTAVVLVGRFLVRPAFRAIARTRLREIFTAAALLLVIAIALLMTRVGLSPALGTFLAGVVLATSEYRHELVGDIEPFKGLLLGLFFISVGATIDFELLAVRPGLVLALVAGVMLLKAAVLLGLGVLFRLGPDQNLLTAASLCQVGEFAFVLFAQAAQTGVLPSDLTATLVAVVAMSMALTPLALLLVERGLLPRLAVARPAERPADAIDEHHPVIIAGFGRFGHIVGRLLRANGVGTTVLDVDADRVDLLRRLGLKVFYGDASRHELLHAAGADKARLLVLALDSPDKTRELVETVRKHFPHLVVMARAEDRADAYDLLAAGVDHVYRDTLDTSLRLGVDALRLLGHRGYQAERAARTFRRHDEAAVRELGALRGDRAAYIDVARTRIADLERILRADLARRLDAQDDGWDVTTLREDVRRAAEAPRPAADPTRAGTSTPPEGV
jgi:monovalent cation:proton antiporter-2 (CPA2) family protein